MPKLLLNCDQVFDVLTRGPFPTGDASDVAVERHLRACHDCRTLAEALQPAVEILHEAISATEATGLPEYQGVLARLDHRVAVAELESAETTPLLVRRLAPAKHTVCVQRRASWVAVYARFTAALVLLVAMGSLIWGAFVTTQPLARNRRSPTHLDQAGLVTLASLHLPTDCFPRELLPTADPAQPETAAAIDQEALRCCTECHNTANPERAVLGSVVTFQLSCKACHSL